jgi:hypothetical protein
LEASYQPIADRGRDEKPQNPAAASLARKILHKSANEQLN